ncbi:hypothetical protein SUGI_1132110 [Cryptomeria japonica]|nr:hypothetical protein SUGI_1132110 [Cryptomeria japonica]
MNFGPSQASAPAPIDGHVRRDLIRNPFQSKKSRNGQVEAIEVFCGLFNSGKIIMEADEGDDLALGSQIFGELKQGIGVAKSGVRHNHRMP